MSDDDRVVAPAERFHPDDRSLGRDLTIGLERVGNLAMDEANAGRALTYYRECLSKREQLLETQEPSASSRTTVEATLDVAIAHGKVADALDALGDRSQARPHFEKYLAMAREVFSKDPSNVQVMRSLSDALEEVGKLARDDAKFPEAESLFGESIAQREALLRADEQDAQARYLLTVAQKHLGDTYWALAMRDLGAENPPVENLLRAKTWYDQAELICELRLRS
jgi:tetratricopeptide (TPR) repeat protein